MSEGGAYRSPGGEFGKVYEQLGYLKSEIGRAPRREDLERMRGELRDMVRDSEDRLKTFMRELDDARAAKMLAALDEAFKHAMPGTVKMVRSEIEAWDAEREEAERRVLEKAGYEKTPEGFVKSKTNPVGKWLKNNITTVIVGIIIIVAIKPEWFAHGINWVLRLAL